MPVRDLVVFASAIVRRVRVPTANSDLSELSTCPSTRGALHVELPGLPFPDIPIGRGAEPGSSSPLFPSVIPSCEFSLLGTHAWRRRHRTTTLLSRASRVSSAAALPLLSPVNLIAIRCPPRKTGTYPTTDRTSLRAILWWRETAGEILSVDGWRRTHWPGQRTGMPA